MTIKKINLVDENPLNRKRISHPPQIVDVSKNGRVWTSENSLICKSNEKTGWEGGGDDQNQLFQNPRN